MSLEGEEEETSCGSSESVAKQRDKLVPMDLLDEYWFFHNALHNCRRVVVPQRPLTLPNKSKDMSPTSSIQHIKDPLVSTAEKSPVGDSFADRSLLRAPSQPPLHAGEDEDDEEADATRTSTLLSTPNNNKKPPLLRAPSMPSPQNSFNSYGSSSSSPKKILMRNASMGRHQVPRHMRKCCTNLHYNRALQEKQRRSSSDLESIEVQGFKDLGFVFDKVGLKDERLATVIPGLREKKAQFDGGGDDCGSSNAKRPPYLSEAWGAQRSAPPTLKWAEERSAADMKEQLKFWARTVACNVRHECC